MKLKTVILLCAGILASAFLGSCVNPPPPSAEFQAKFKQYTQDF